MNQIRKWAYGIMMKLDGWQETNRVDFAEKIQKWYENDQAINMTLRSDIWGRIWCIANEQKFKDI